MIIMDILQIIWDAHLHPSKAWFEKQKIHFTKYIWKNKSNRIESTDNKRREIIEKRLTKNTNFNNIYERKMIIFIKATKKRIELQEYSFVMTTPNGQEKFDISLVNLIRLEPNQKPIHLTPGSYGIKKGLTPDGPFTKSFSGILYQDDYRKAFHNNSFLSDLMVPNFEEAVESKFEYTSWINCLEMCAKYHKILKVLIKFGSIKLATDIVSNYNVLRRNIYSRRFLESYSSFIKLNPVPKTVDYIVERFNKYEGVLQFFADRNLVLSDFNTTTKTKKNLNDIFKNSPLKYIDFTKLITPLPSIRELDELIKSIEWLEKYRFEIEFCQKVGAIQLVNELFEKFFTPMNLDYHEHDKTDNYLNRNFLSQHKQYLKQDINLDELNLVVDIESNIEGFNKLTKNYRLQELSLKKYLLKTEFDFKYYDEYINGLHELGWNLTKKILYPNNPFQALAEVRDALKNNKDTILSRKFKEQTLKNNKYVMNIDNFQFILPQSPVDLVAEGLALNNCLNTYQRKYALGEAVIVFMRDSSNPDKPLYAIEMHDDRATQFRGNNNSTPPKIASDVLSKYVEKIRSIKQAS